MKIRISEEALNKAIEKQRLNEIDWEKEFSDVQKSCPRPQDVVKYLNDVKSQANVEHGHRKQFTKKYPFLAPKSRMFKKGGSVDIDHFIKQITTPPRTVISQNKKLSKSGQENEFVYNTGIPALRGIAYDIEKGQFFYINTCIGAGECINYCYALKGNYIRYPAVYDSFTKRLNYLLNFPDKYEEQMYKEIKKACKSKKAIKGGENKVIIRWNDSGDFFAKRYVKMAQDVIARLKNEGYNVDDYVYTKVADVAQDTAFGSASFSADANKRQRDKIDRAQQKMSLTVPMKFFISTDGNELNYNNPDEANMIKQNIAGFFNVEQENIISYDELMKTSSQGEPKWHVIVTPKDGDDAAMRNDVKSVLLKIH